MKIKLTVALLAALPLFTACAQQAANRRAYGPCEGCEAVFEYGDKKLQPSDTLPDFNDKGERIKIHGTIFKNDGKTPASGVILYIYHTDQAGIYPTKGNETGWGKRHGYLRGWIKTGADGHYAFYTLRPASYPNSRNPQHIHATVKEPDKKEYWIDEYLFDDDPFLTDVEKGHLQDRTGSGIIHLTKGNGMLLGKRDIILGKNIPNY